MTSKVDKIRELTHKLLEYCHEYYVLDNPSISDKEYDELYDELFKLEEETGFYLTISPTRKVQGQILDGFSKIKHSKPMLSADKTKEVDKIKKFVKDHDFYCSYKLDGLTLVCIYENGKFKQAITRGDGLVGEDVTEQAKMIKNLPMTIPYNDYLEIRGECVIPWSSFHEINSTLSKPYAHPRNLAAGSLRNLDTNITKQRNLSYVVFECVSDLYDEDDLFDSKWDELGYLDYLGFETVERCFGAVDDCVEAMQPEFYRFPVDGLIFEFTGKSYSKSLPATGHHEGCRLALKWKDDTYETILRDVVWDVGRSGIISPVAVFDEVDLDGALTTRASLHNLSIIKSLKLGIGDVITVYRANMVIPNIDKNLTQSDTLEIPKICPRCGADTEEIILGQSRFELGSKFLMCTNPDCPAKLLSKFTYFVSRNCANIDGLSEKTLEQFIIRGYLNSFKDLYHLDQYKDKLFSIEGLGQKSVLSILKAIEKSRNIKFENFLTAIGIPDVGLSTAKTIAARFDDFQSFISRALDFNWTDLDGVGEITARKISDYIKGHLDEIKELGEEFNFIEEEKVEISDNPFNGKNVAVTGKLNHFTRDTINAKLESLGAKPVGGVTSTTHYLINNDSTSSSSKNKKANELGIPIITEEEFLNMLGDIV